MSANDFYTYIILGMKYKLQTWLLVYKKIIITRRVD